MIDGLESIHFIRSAFEDINRNLGLSHPPKDFPISSI